MTLPDQSQTEVRRLTTSLTKPKVSVNIGCRYVRMLYCIGKSAQFAREMDKYKIDVMGISECRWMGQGKVKMNTGESIIVFRERRQHTQTRSSNNDDEESRTSIAEMETYQW